METGLGVGSDWSETQDGEVSRQEFALCAPERNPLIIITSYANRPVHVRDPLYYRHTDKELVRRKNQIQG
jgi:hypothetical protein